MEGGFGRVWRMVAVVLVVVVVVLSSDEEAGVRLVRAQSYALVVGEGFNHRGSNSNTKAAVLTLNLNDLEAVGGIPPCIITGDTYECSGPTETVLDVDVYENEDGALGFFVGTFSTVYIAGKSPDTIPAHGFAMFDNGEWYSPCTAPEICADTQGQATCVVYDYVEGLVYIGGSFTSWNGSAANGLVAYEPYYDIFSLFAEVSENVTQVNWLGIFQGEGPYAVASGFQKDDKPFFFAFTYDNIYDEDYPEVETAGRCAQPPNDDYIDWLCGADEGLAFSYGSILDVPSNFTINDLTFDDPEIAFLVGDDATTTNRFLVYNVSSRSMVAFTSHPSALTAILRLGDGTVFVGSEDEDLGISVYIVDVNGDGGLVVIGASSPFKGGRVSDVVGVNSTLFYNPPPTFSPSTSPIITASSTRSRRPSIIPSSSQSPRQSIPPPPSASTSASKRTPTASPRRPTATPRRSDKFPFEIRQGDRFLRCNRGRSSFIWCDLSNDNDKDTRLRMSILEIQEVKIDNDGSRKVVQSQRVKDGFLDVDEGSFSLKTKLKNGAKVTNEFEFTERDGVRKRSGKEIQLRRGYCKWTLAIEDWKFKDSKNKLLVQMQLVQMMDGKEVKLEVSREDLGDSVLYDFELKRKRLFQMNLEEWGLIDGKVEDIDIDLRRERVLEFIFPSFEDTLEFDPSFAMLLGTPAGFGGRSGGWRWVDIATLTCGAVAVVLAVVIVVVGNVNRSRKRKAVLQHLNELTHGSSTGDRRLSG